MARISGEKEELSNQAFAISHGTILQRIKSLTAFLAAISVADIYLASLTLRSIDLDKLKTIYNYFLPIQNSGSGKLQFFPLKSSCL